MKMFFTIVSTVIVISAIMAFEILSPDGKAGYSGAPGEGNCTSCHDGSAVNSGGATVAITVDPSMGMMGGYIPGHDYTITATISNSQSPNHKRFGVDVVALLSSGANGGTITITNTTLTKLKTNKVGSNTRNNVVHTGSQNVGPGTQTFSFKWTAPAQGTGTVTIYASMMGANNDGGTDGDKVYTTSLVVPEAGMGVSDSKIINNLSIFPNPSNGSFQVSTGDVEFSSNSNAQIFNASGKLVFNSSMYNSTTEMNLSNQPAGIYFVKVYNGSTIQSGKVIIN